MKRATRAALVFAVGWAVGWMGGSSAERRPPIRDELKQPITVRRENEKASYLVPYSVSVDGRSETVGEKGSGPMVVMHLAGARIQIAATSEPDPR